MQQIMSRSVSTIHHSFDVANKLNQSTNLTSRIAILEHHCVLNFSLQLIFSVFGTSIFENLDRKSSLQSNLFCQKYLENGNFSVKNKRRTKKLVFSTMKRKIQNFGFQGQLTIKLPISICLHITFLFIHVKRYF